MNERVARRLRGRCALARLIARLRRDDGSAIIEFTMVAVLIMAPLVYLVVAVAAIQRTSSAAGDAARAAGRAIGSASTVADGLARADAALRITVDDAHLPADAARMRIVPTSSDCEGPQRQPTLMPGDSFLVCVLITAPVPGIPSVLGGGRHTAIGRYVVHVDDFAQNR